jgi:hypothetical protein
MADKAARPESPADKVSPGKKPGSPDQATAAGQAKSRDNAGQRGFYNGLLGGSMFDSLADRIREDEQVTAGQRYIRWAAILVISVVLFGGLYFGVSFLNT